MTFTLLKIAIGSTTYFRKSVTCHELLVGNIAIMSRAMKDRRVLWRSQIHMRLIITERHLGNDCRSNWLFIYLYLDARLDHRRFDVVTRVPV